MPPSSYTFLGHCAPRCRTLPTVRRLGVESLDSVRIIRLSGILSARGGASIKRAAVHSTIRAYPFHGDTVFLCVSRVRVSTPPTRRVFRGNKAHPRADLIVRASRVMPRRSPGFVRQRTRPCFTAVAPLLHF